MSTLRAVRNYTSGATTSVGGVNCDHFQVLPAAPAGGGVPPRRSLAEFNSWLRKNARKADAHARESTKRLTGRDSL